MDGTRYPGATDAVSFSVDELTGALGDSVTVLPIVVAVGALTELSLSRMLLGFGAFQIVWGLRYGLPISVEPMKALAALAIAGTLGADELAIAGLLAGVVLLGVGTTGALGRVARYVGEPVTRGIQLAVALLLLQTGVELSLGDPTFALAGVVAAAVVVAAGYRRASALVVLGVGLAIALAGTGVPQPTLPTVGLALPGPSGLTRSAAEATAAQLAMTVGNAAVATALLLSEYYDADVTPDELASSMGAMNLAAVPFGALPMCHGSGGVAGKYAFGARTAGSNVMLGGLYGVAALGTAVVTAFPMAVLGVVLALVAVELGRSALGTDHLPTTLAVGALGLLTNVGVAFLAGVAWWVARERLL
ncbi:putative sulfate/molybdate transporter [Halolamina sediminis]|uniref:putative sulfate/molybdate transporter n=1 Tax=Halolamina sediminis TaxID=1480675 RepID=UPI0006B64DE1|nr:putative sulfate/molybdate transporter [Halolamina sediminis]